jgi:hypothetical protein
MGNIFQLLCSYLQTIQFLFKTAYNDLKQFYKEKSMVALMIIQKF